MNSSHTNEAGFYTWGLPTSTRVSVKAPKAETFEYKGNKYWSSSCIFCALASILWTVTKPLHPISPSNSIRDVKPFPSASHQCDPDDLWSSNPLNDCPKSNQRTGLRFSVRCSSGNNVKLFTGGNLTHCEAVKWNLLVGWHHSDGMVSSFCHTHIKTGINTGHTEPLTQTLKELRIQQVMLKLLIKHTVQAAV